MSTNHYDDDSDDDDDELDAFNTSSARPRRAIRKPKRLLSDDDEPSAAADDSDDDIEIIVAGRGTDVLSGADGVTVLGEVNGPEEDAFFDSIRFLLVPYSKDNKYGAAFAASSTVTRSFAYGTPIICILDGALIETAAEGGAVSVDGGIEAIAVQANSVVRDEAVLEKLAVEVKQLQAERTVAHCVAPFLDAWSTLGEDSPVR